MHNLIYSGGLGERFWVIVGSLFFLCPRGAGGGVGLFAGVGMVRWVGVDGIFGQKGLCFCRIRVHRAGEFRGRRRAGGVRARFKGLLPGARGRGNRVTRRVGGSSPLSGSFYVETKKNRRIAR